jgi:uncharacterized protein (DUF1501 family)
MRVRAQLEPFSGEEFTPPVQYPSDEFFPGALAGLAAMLAAGLPLRCVSLDAPGSFDTHENEPGDFADNIKLVADSVAAFQADLEARGIADRVVTLVWSEFGRRPQENGSLGTDHGAGGAALVIGSRVRGQMIGEWPGLDQLDPQGNMRATSDFRALYCSLIEQWFGVDAGAVIPGAGGMARPAVIG